MSSKRIQTNSFQLIMVILKKKKKKKKKKNIYKFIYILGRQVKNRVGRVTGNRQFFLLSLIERVIGLESVDYPQLTGRHYLTIIQALS